MFIKIWSILVLNFRTFKSDSINIINYKLFTYLRIKRVGLKNKHFLSHCTYKLLKVLNLWTQQKPWFHNTKLLIPDFITDYNYLLKNDNNYYYDDDKDHYYHNNHNDNYDNTNSKRSNILLANKQWPHRLHWHVRSNGRLERQLRTEPLQHSKLGYIRQQRLLFDT